MPRILCSASVSQVIISSALAVTSGWWPTNVQLQLFNLGCFQPSLTRSSPNDHRKSREWMLLWEAIKRQKTLPRWLVQRFNNITKDTASLSPLSSLQCWPHPVTWLPFLLQENCKEHWGCRLPHPNPLRESLASRDFPRSRLQTPYCLSLMEIRSRDFPWTNF